MLGYGNFPLYIFWFLHQTTTRLQHQAIRQQLYIFWFLHQTTTDATMVGNKTMLYIFWFLHQTTTILHNILTSLELYIFWFLHQTTTLNLYTIVLIRCISFDSYIKPQPGTSLQNTWGCCISFDSYIKPQLVLRLLPIMVVVYLLIPTSNHNYFLYWGIAKRLYIFWFLHQTTTCSEYGPCTKRCISFDSYIKPQPYIG